jgi:hypothetical protein
MDTRLQADPDLSPVEKAIVRLKLHAHDSAQESDHSAAVKGLDDQLGTAAQALTTAPANYRPGALSTLVNADEDAGAVDSAATLRPAAIHEPLLLPFARLSADKQKAALDALPEEARLRPRSRTSRRACCRAASPTLPIRMARASGRRSTCASRRRSTPTCS